MVKKLVALFVCLLLLSPASQAANVDRNDPVLKEIETYLSNLTTIVADFSQISPDGNLASGKFYLQRPDKMRWQYDPPTPVLMVTNGKFLTFYDYELEQVSDIPLDSTIVGFLAKEDIRFDDSVTLESLEKGQGSVRVTVYQTGKPKDGKLTLELTTKPMQLKNMIVTDKLNQTTTVALNNARFGVGLDQNLFNFKDPRISRKPRR